jgi:glycosyltransferase involved in cell wall biosynthesis
VRIAGYCPDADLANELLGLAETSANVSVELGSMTEAELERHIDDADAVILPYRNILNSGAALHALSRFRPVIVPRQGSLAELQGEVGTDWVYLYDGSLTPEVLRDAIRWLRTTRRNEAPNLAKHDWSIIGRQAARFLTNLGRPGVDAMQSSVCNIDRGL